MKFSKTMLLRCYTDLNFLMAQGNTVAKKNTFSVHIIDKYHHASANKIICFICYDKEISFRNFHGTNIYIFNYFLKSYKLPWEKYLHLPLLS